MKAMVGESWNENRNQGPLMLPTCHGSDANGWESVVPPSLKQRGVVPSLKHRTRQCTIENFCPRARSIRLHLKNPFVSRPCARMGCFGPRSGRS